MTDAHVFDFLQAQSFFPDRDRHPQGPLVIFKSIARGPGRSPRKLDRIQDNENITLVNPGEETGKGSKIWAAGGNNHDSANDSGLPLQEGVKGRIFN